MVRWVTLGNPDPEKGVSMDWDRAALLVSCPRCGSPAGVACDMRGTHYKKTTHIARTDRAVWATEKVNRIVVTP